MTSGPDIEVLKALSTNSQSRTDWSTLVVLLGLIGEIVVTFAYTKDKRRSEIVFGVLFTVVIALGVYGEYKFGSQAARSNAQLQGISESKIADLNLEAQKYRERADVLEHQIAARHITVEQRMNMLAVLEVRPESKITIWYVINSDADTLAYTREIQDVFHDAKWRVLHRPNLISMDTPLHGFIVEVQHDSPQNQSVASLAAKALAVTGYHVSRTNISPDPNQETDVIVLVGGK
jgi:hypothetical protein